MGAEDTQRSARWLSQADRFWAGVLGVDYSELRNDGFHLFERADVAGPPQATVVATSSATILSLSAGGTDAFRNAGFDLERMQRSPRKYVNESASIDSLDVRGLAYLAYWPSSSLAPSPRRQTELLDDDGRSKLTSFGEIAPEEWADAGIGPDSRVFGVRIEDQIVAVAGYARWPGEIAQLQVFCHPNYRRRGLAAEPLKAAIGDALINNLLPQYRARDDNIASLALAKRLGFVEYGWMATIRVRLSA